jgi:predicted NBD/HSP70 family sugar kinase
MTQLVKDLLQDGLLVELDQTAASVGRPARKLALVSAAGRAIGVKVVEDHVAFVEVGIDGTVTRSASEPFVATSPTFLSDLTALLRRFIEGGRDTPLLGIGVGVPGSVDRQSNGEVDSAVLGWQQVPLGATLRRELALPVIVDNNVNALAVAERLYGLGRNHDSFLVLTIGTGVGAGIVLDGVVLRGASGGAGEVGHIPVGDGGGLVPKDDRGSLESYVGEAALVLTARDRGIIGPESGIAALQAAADAGDPAAAAVYSEAGHVLGRALAGIVHTVDPEIVIVLGEGTASWRHWSYGFEPSLRSALLPYRRGLAVAVETWADESWAQGAAALVLATPFDQEGLSGDQGRLVRERLVEQSARQDEVRG